MAVLHKVPLHSYPSMYMSSTIYTGYYIPFSNYQNKFAHRKFPTSRGRGEISYNAVKGGGVCYAKFCVKEDHSSSLVRCNERFIEQNVCKVKQRYCSSADTQV